MTAAHELVNLGLKDAGYEYVNSKSNSFSGSNGALIHVKLMIAGPSKQEETPLPISLCLIRSLSHQESRV
jgi:hypothetical protein